MSDWPAGPLEPPPCLSSLSLESLGADLAAYGNGLTLLASVVWPSANRALLVPFAHYGSKPLVVAQLFAHNGATVSGNIDLGIYSAAFQRLVSTGSVAQAGTSDLQGIAAVASLGPGTSYYLALACDNAVATFMRLAPAAVGLGMMGVVQMAAAFPLPATITPANPSQAYLPQIGLSQRSFL